MESKSTCCIDTGDSINKKNSFHSFYFVEKQDSQVEHLTWYLSKKKEFYKVSCSPGSYLFHGPSDEAVVLSVFFTIENGPHFLYMLHCKRQIMLPGKRCHHKFCLGNRCHHKFCLGNRCQRY